MLLKKYLQPFEGVLCFWKKLKANLGVRCYLHIFCRFLKFLDVIKKLKL